ncbi:hypothetical protein [Ramlibacter humi]|uniref:Peptidase C39-like domain-containing protein n=1 Tax=Ramlibacter humi TaxID=2530451 RepID=A0A4Z0CC97_9BURK|nr:hypothetical protein [Ramlibacter humi]TFZ07709.1 hypothetical protein EZ216_00655 [Ramlibacter humi]
MRFGQWATILAFLAMFTATQARAETKCRPAAEAGVEHCVSGLRADAVAEMRQTQRASQWCWAAAVSMVLRSYGVRVPQEQVVRQHWGSAVDIGVPPAVLGTLLNRRWNDASGRAVSLASDVRAGAQARLGSPEVLQDLQDGRPVVVVLPGHAVVLVQVEFQRRRDSGAVQLLGAVALDPAREGLRTLKPDAAVVQVTRSAPAGGDQVASAGVEAEAIH